jgi:hypothetical protein
MHCYIGTPATTIYSKKGITMFLFCNVSATIGKKKKKGKAKVKLSL